MPHTPFIDSLSRIARGFCLSLGLISILNGTFVPASLAVDPDIQVEQPLGNALVSGVSVLNFGGMSIGGTPVVRQFTVRNIVPAATLGLGSVSVSGAAADDFSLNLAGMAGSISSDTTTFSVTYYPSQTGTRSAVLTIANTDPDESPFVISLTGSSTSAAPPSQSVEAPVALGAHCIGDGPFVLPVVATSGLPVSVEITAGAAVGSVSGRTFTPSGIPGPVTIKISQPGGGGYDAATPIYRSFSVVADRFAKLFQSGVAGQAAGIKEDGTLWMWGAGSGGQLGVGSTSNSRLPLKVGTDTNWGTVSPGGNHTLALKTDGTIWGWGINSTYQLGIGNNVQKTSPERIGTGTNWVAISAGSFHSMGIKSDGSLWAWGQNSSYQLGLGDTTTRTTPTRVGTDNDWIAVAAGSSHTIALRSDHTLWAWGSNTSGQLGVGDLTTRTTPTQVGLDTDWAKVVATTSTSYAIRSTGTLWGWGGNGSYNLGLGSTGNRNLPTQIGIFNDWIAIAPCGSSCAGLRSDHSLWTWGSGSLTGQTASGTTSTRTSPIQVGTDKDWASAAAIVSNLYLLKTDGTIWAVGANSSGQLAAPNNNPSYLAGGGIRAIGHGGSSTHYIRNDGTMWAIGTNYPNVGYPAGSTGNQPTQIGTDSDWAAVAAASGHTLALKTDGTLWGAGSSSSGQLGNGSTGTLSVFTRIGTDTNWAKIAVGTVFSAGIKTDGSLWAWGSNTSGQLGLGNQTSTTSITRVGTANDWAAVACGGSHMAVLKTNGSLWTCGSNSFGQLGLGDTVQRTSLTQAAGTGWSDVACGTSHILLKKTNGQIWSTGLNANGQLGDGTFSSRSSPVQIGADSDWVMIMTGSTHSVALKANGDLWGWGSNGYGQLVGASGSSINTPLLLTTLGRYALLGNGSQSIHTVVARQDGSLWGFGANADHQLTNNVRMSSILTYAYPTISEQSVTQATVSVVTYGSATPLNGTATSGLPVSYVVSGPASVADGEITVTGPGPVRLVAYQNGDASTWHNAPPIEVTVELPPWAEALPADNVAKTSATVYGNAYGDNVATTISIEYDNDIGDSTYAFSTAALPGSATLEEITPVSANLSGLTPGTVYHYRVVATNSRGTAYSEDATFTTPAPEIGIFDGTLLGSALTDAIGSVDFGSVSEGATVTRTFTIENTGNGDLESIAVSASGDWSVDLTGMATTLAPSTSTSFTATFTPSASGARNGGITVTSDDVDEASFDIAVVGFGLTPQTIAFTLPPEISCGAPLALSAMATSGLPVSYAITSGVTVAALEGQNVVFSGTGSVTIEATQAGNTTYAAASPVSQTFNVVKGDQVITFDVGTPASASYHASVNLVATSSRGLTPVGFTIVGGPGNIAGNNLTFTAPGAVTIQATQSGDACFNPGSAQTTITATNAAPIADGQTKGGDEDTLITGTVSATDADPATTLNYIKVTDPTHGSVTINPNGSFSYQPASDYNGPDSFTFKANDGLTDSNIATVTLTITPVNDPPVAESGSVGGDEDTTITDTLTGSDIENSTLTYSKVTEPAHGVVTVNSNGSFSYQPEQNYNGTDSFTFKINDGELDSNIATITVTIDPVNDAPVANALSEAGDEDTAITGTLTGADIESSPLTFIKVTEPTHGSVTINPNGSFSYQPASDYNGPDSFTFKASDGLADSNIATVSLTITAINDVPVADAQSLSTPDSIAKDIVLTGSDVDLTPLTFAIVSPPSHGTLTGTPPTISYISDAGFAGGDSFTFTVNDGTVDSAAATVAITVTPVAPVVTTQPLAQTVNPGTAVQLSVANTGSNPLSYQWRKNSEEIDGATGQTLSFASIQEGDEASYDVVISNVAGSTTSNPATLTVNDPIVIAVQPPVLSVSETDAVTLTVSPTGTGPFTYQWRKDGSPLPNGDGDTLIIETATLGDAGHYDVIVTNIVGPQVSSGTQLRVIGDTPEIVIQPQHQLVEVGTPLTLSVTALGKPPLTYQWKRNGVNLRGATLSTYSLTSTQLAHAGAYTVVVTSTASVASDTAQLGVAENPGKALTQVIGSTAVMSLKTAGSGLAHVWKKDGGSLLADARLAIATTGKGLTIKKLITDDSATYTCEVTGPGGTLVAGTHELRVFDAAPDITPLDTGDALPPAIVSGEYDYQVPVDPSTDRAPTLFSASGLPKGLKIDSKTGLISGRAVVSKAAAYAVKITAANSKGKDIVNVTLQVSALPDGAIGVFAGPVSRHAIIGDNLGGRIDLTTTVSGSLSGKLTLGRSVYPFRGILAASLTSSNPHGSVFITRRGLPTLVLDFDIDPASNRLANATITDGTATVGLEAWRYIWHATRNPAGSRDGLYTFGLDIDPLLAGDPLIPQGNGYGSFKVTTAGKATVTGKTADGETITTAAFVGPLGEILVYRTLYTTVTKGTILGTLLINEGADIDDDSDNPLSGELSWSRPPNTARTARTYEDGFGPITVTVIGGRYLPPAAGQIVLGLAPGADNAQLTFAGAGIESATNYADVTLEISSLNRALMPTGGSAANPAKVTLTITPTTGAFRGSLTLIDENPLGGAAVKRTLTYQGLLLPAIAGNRGCGYSLAPQLPATVGDTSANTDIQSGQVILQGKD